MNSWRIKDSVMYIEEYIMPKKLSSHTQFSIGASENDAKEPSPNQRL